MRMYQVLIDAACLKGKSPSLDTIECVSLATGAKCLSASQIPRCRGLVLHDCHAEILAIRAFNHWLLRECQSVLDSERELRHASASDEYPNSSPYIRRRVSHPSNQPSGSRSWPPFEIQPDVKLYMYCTCAPCGDASMELCMAAQEDPTPWELPPKTDPKDEEPSTTTAPTLLNGRGYFSNLGVVRRKPSRADAESTLSKSCSDKLALRQVSSLLSYPTSLLVAPTEAAYITALVLPEEEISNVACARAFGDGETGRMRELKGREWGVGTDGNHSGYKFRPFNILSVPTAEVEALWPFAKPKDASASEMALESTDVSKKDRKKSKISNTSAVWTAAPSSAAVTGAEPARKRSKISSSAASNTTGLHETIINGVKQGNKATMPTVRGASGLSRAKMWLLLRDIVRPAPLDGDARSESSALYKDREQDIRSLPDDVARQRILEAGSYEDFKRDPDSCPDWVKLRETALQEAKLVLKDWVPNRGDEQWSLESLADMGKPKKSKMTGPVDTSG
ncbi:hypothetical protein PVAR5_0239 [Paecilomyces variotii No. 5]|uniref:A to I editase domain-containing protein n=1 Tax=Byssochlamys spectabilis (strain No. 5 / NBRC 109023) TaxID=1356009 RepID=V5FPY7_BYSSN|nr:hypothetical protein PVAR5_0239 [Paecilomyces variotii No. 5]